MPHPVLLDDDTLIAACEVTRLRRGGPGGQHRNKVETAVRLEHRETGVIAEANESRSQETNKRQALKRLRLKLALEVRTDVDRHDALQDHWDRQCRGGRINASVTSKSGPCLVAFALNVLDLFDYDVPPACERLKCSSSQLVKFLKTNGSVFAIVNDRREAAGRHRLS